MIALIIILLLLGLAASLLELKEERNIKAKILPSVYILVFIITSIVAWNSYQDEEDIHSKISLTSEKVEKIDSTLSTTMDNLSEISNRSAKILEDLDSYQDSISSIVNMNKNLIKKYETLNGQLRDQINYNEQVRIANAPHLSVPHTRMKWKESESGINFEACFF